MATVSEHPVVLRLDPRKKALTPLNRRGLEHTQKSRRRLRAKYRDATILLPDGEVLPIEDFILGRSTDFGGRWPLPWLSFSGERYLTLVFGPSRREALDQTKRTVVEYLELDTHRDFWVRNGETWEELLARVREARSHRELFDALHLTSAEDGVDVFG